MHFTHFFASATLLGAIALFSHCSQFAAAQKGDGEASSTSSSSSGGAGQNGSSGTFDGGASSGTFSSASSSGEEPEEESGPPLTPFEQGTLDGFNAIRASAVPTPSPALPTSASDPDQLPY